MEDDDSEFQAKWNSVLADLDPQGWIHENRDVSVLLYAIAGRLAAMSPDERAAKVREMWEWATGRQWGDEKA